MASNIFSNSKIEVIVLGAGQDVGRSCIVVRLMDKTVMFDCGIHMGFNDHRKFPDFKHLAHYYPSATSYNEVIDCVIISHFHLDHVGALPYFTEHASPTKFTNPIIMTHPTKAICPILLHDWSKIQKKQDRHNKNKNKIQLSYNEDDVTRCISKATGVSLHEVYELSPGFTIKSFYAGHVLGAAMFVVCYKGQSVLYTGDYNMTPDRHLGAAMATRCRPDLLISESTYATMIRESRRIRERNFFTKVHECITNGGKVLIPVFALGRAQELMILLESYWDRMDLSVPIYFSAGLAQKANEYYKFFVCWCNESVKRNLLENERNVFDFPHIKKWDNNQMHAHKPCVLLATTGMLHAGTSLRVFKEWCHDERNLIVLPGYCVQNTVGGQILAGKKQIVIDGKTYNVNIQVANLSFSAHADMKGILQLIRSVGPKNVMLVHGEQKKMKSLKRKIECELSLACYTPSNHTSVKIEPWRYIPVNVDRKDIYPSFNSNSTKTHKQVNTLQGHLIISKTHGDTIPMEQDQKEEKTEKGNNGYDVQFVKGNGNDSDICHLLNASKHHVLFDLFCCLTPHHLLKNKNNVKATLMWLYDTVNRNLCNDYKVQIKENCIEIYEQHANGQDQSDANHQNRFNLSDNVPMQNGLNCVTMYVEQKENDNNNTMDVDCSEETHKHNDAHALRVRIIYPHNLTETASLVQSLVNITCDSYC